MGRRFTPEQMQEGKTAYHGGRLDLEECPHADGDQRLMWRAGWIAGLVESCASFVGMERRDDAIIALSNDHDIQPEDLAAWDLTDLDDAMEDRGYVWIAEDRAWGYPQEVQP